MSEITQAVPAAELFTPEFRLDPYPTYARLRENSPVCRVQTPRFETWLVTRYADARAVLSDPRLSKDIDRAGDLYLQVFGEKSVALNRNMLNADPPEHTRLRRLVSQAFTPRRIEALAPRVQQIVDQLLDTIVPAGRAELISEFALPLPMNVICELLGVPAEDREQFFSGTQVIRTQGTAGRSNEEDRAAIQEAQQNLYNYLTKLVGNKRDQPSDDLISALIAARDDGGKLSEEELVSTAFLLLFAGHQTTADFIGNAVTALLTNPDQLDLITKNPELLPGAIEELLRFNGSVPVASFRLATEDVEYSGVRIPKGSIVTVVLNAANHDPRHFPDPDSLKVDRTENPHMAFGYGVHYCLGVSLARMEARTAIGTLLRRLPNLTLEVAPEELRWLPAASSFRGLLELPVRFEPSGRPQR
ncbi:cytochrome P450 family protein [Protofrankia symbiont of Coriaria ruscifolia]|uniref:cytochrome P450 family protein n=1 Tax=Protofrankia symbiont of Coriaria ruscifolia TaxID=1306542 RepID=UPI0010413710|nr:cytochrome P450 [Protofrankia symbiont of Coriaria ruscifolia]